MCIFVFYLCLNNYSMCLKHFWMKQKESICLSVTLKSSVLSGLTLLLKPGKCVDGLDITKLGLGLKS